MHKDPRVARSLSILAFSFACLVSLVIFFTAETLDGVDYVFMVVWPPALAAIAYVVGLYHDPSAPD